MLQFQATTLINATPATIWKILTDANGYPTWDPGVVRIEGTIAPGQKITAYTKLDPKRAFPAKVQTFNPEQSMTWVGGMPLGLFKGVRTFLLTPKSATSTEFTVREEFSGPLLPLIRRTLPNLNQVFEQFTAGLKAHAEQISSAS